MSIRHLTLSRATGHRIRTGIISAWLLAMAMWSEHPAISLVWAGHAVAVIVDHRSHSHRLQTR